MRERKMKKAIIFDFDGLIIDTESAWHYAFETHLKENFQYDMKMEDFLTCIGSTNDHFMQRLNEDINLGDGKEELLRTVNAAAKDRSENLPLMAGIYDLLEYAKANDIVCVIGTSSNREHIERHLDRLNIRQYFDHYVTSDIVENIKPNPDIYNKAAELIGHPKEDIVIFEDSLNGLIAGNRAGIDVVIVANMVTKHIDFPETYLDLVHSMEDYSYQDLFSKE